MSLFSAGYRPWYGSWTALSGRILVDICRKGGFKMAKDPAFLFYPNDYIGGTMGMTFEEKGAYMELLMMQFNRGHMTSHMIGQTIGQLWDKVQDKFIQDEKGLWYNNRLEEEKNKRKSFTQSRRNNISGNNQYTKKQEKKVGYMTSHMEDVNEDVNESIDLIYYFNSENFINSWNDWKSYKLTEHKFKYKALKSEQAALTELYNLSLKNEVTAIKIINKSIANGWKGFFSLKTEQEKNKSVSSNREKQINSSFD